MTTTTTTRPNMPELFKAAWTLFKTAAKGTFARFGEALKAAWAAFRSPAVDIDALRAEVARIEGQINGLKAAYRAAVEATRKAGLSGSSVKRDEARKAEAAALAACKGTELQDQLAAAKAALAKATKPANVDVYGPMTPLAFNVGLAAEQAVALKELKRTDYNEWFDRVHG